MASVVAGTLAPILIKDLTKNKGRGIEKLGKDIGKGIGKIFGFKNGGKVTRTGVYKLHKGEVVVPASVVNRRPTKRKPAGKPVHKPKRKPRRPRK